MSTCPDMSPQEDINTSVPESWPELTDARKNQLKMHQADRARAKLRERTFVLWTSSVVGSLIVVLFLIPATRGLALGLLLIAASFPVYFLPTLLAWSGNHRNIGAIAIVNLLLGWTLLGWVAALVWAVYKEKK